MIQSAAVARAMSGGRLVRLPWWGATSTSQPPGPEATNRRSAGPSRSPVSSTLRPAASTERTRLVSLSEVCGQFPTEGCSTRTRQSGSSANESPPRILRTAIPAPRACRTISATPHDPLSRNGGGTTISPMSKRSINSGTALKWSVSACEITSVSIRFTRSCQSTAAIARRAAAGAPSRPAS